MPHDRKRGAAIQNQRDLTSRRKPWAWQRLSLTFLACSGAPRHAFVLRAVFEPLLDRFVSDDEPEALRGGRVFCPLQIEAVEWDAVRHEFCPAFFKRDEVELIVGFPVVAHGVGRAIL